jgi:hypothetical protein
MSSGSGAQVTVTRIAYQQQAVQVSCKPPGGLTRSSAESFRLACGLALVRRTDVPEKHIAFIFRVTRLCLSSSPRGHAPR